MSIPEVGEGRLAENMKSRHYFFKFLPISGASSHISHFDLLFDLVYSGVEMSVSKITQKVSVGF